MTEVSVVNCNSVRIIPAQKTMKAAGARLSLFKRGIGIRD